MYGTSEGWMSQNKSKKILSTNIRMLPFWLYGTGAVTSEENDDEYETETSINSTKQLSGTGKLSTTTGP